MNADSPSQPGRCRAAAAAGARPYRMREHRTRHPAGGADLCPRRHRTGDPARRIGRRGRTRSRDHPELSRPQRDGLARGGEPVAHRSASQLGRTARSGGPAHARREPVAAVGQRSGHCLAVVAAPGDSPCASRFRCCSSSPWRARAWCSSPAGRLLSPDATRVLLTQQSEIVEPIAEAGPAPNAAGMSRALAVLAVQIAESVRAAPLAPRAVAR